MDLELSIKADDVAGADKIVSPTDSEIPTRPILRRENSAPAPPQQPPPPTPQDGSNSIDSLSLVRLKRFVSDLPPVEVPTFAYDYQDTHTFAEELEEWFQYTAEDEYMLMSGKKVFGDKWHQFMPSSLLWTEAKQAQRKEFICSQLREFAILSTVDRVRTLQATTYVALGVWYDTAGLEDTSSSHTDERFDPPNEPYRTSSEQTRWIRNASKTLVECNATQQLYDVMRLICDHDT